MKIDSVLAGIRQSQNIASADGTKTASASPGAPNAAPEAHAAPREALMSALNGALSTEKVANDKANPVSDVMKIANDLAGVEQDARVKEAQVMGAAFADAFVARLGAWQKTAGELVQQGGSQNAAQPYAKLAQENPGLLQQAQGLGYADTRAQLEKQAQDAHAQGFNDTVQLIAKTASDEFIKGAAMMNNVLTAVAAS